MVNAPLLVSLASKAASCPRCVIRPDLPNLVLSNGTVNIIGPNVSLSVSGFSTAGVEFTAYTSFSGSFSGSANQVNCVTLSTNVSLNPLIFVPAPTTGDIFYAAETPFVYGLDPGCSISNYAPSPAPSLIDFVSTVPLSSSNLPKTLSSLPPVRSAVSSPPVAPAIDTVRPSATSQTPQSPSAGSTETKKLILGLVIAIVVPVLLITIGLSSFCIVRRRRRRRKDDTAVPPTDVRKDEGGDTQLYFQQKVELDDEQRRHEMEAVELRYEMEGEDRIHELPGAEVQRLDDRQELRGEEHAKELETSTA